MPGYSYQWTGPSGYTSTDSSISSLYSGSYACVITDTNGCAVTINTELYQPDQLEYNSYNVADVSPPSFSEYSFGRGNDYILLETSEGIYSDPDATMPVTAQDFELVVDFGDLNGASSITLESIADTSGRIPTAGEKPFRMNLNVVGSANGTESVIVNPLPNEVYDAGGNLMSASEATDQYFLLPSPTFNINSDLSSDNGYFI